VSVTPGETYFFQPFFVSGGGGWGTLAARYGYPSGTAFFNGTSSPNIDLWFREGIVVPEPSSAWLVLLGAGMFIWCRRKNCRSR